MTLSILGGAAVLSCALWLGLLLFRGGFWRARAVLGKHSRTTPEPTQWPAVAVVIPARNEAEGIGRAVASVLGQDYPGPLELFLVDDHSDDGTADAARAGAGPDDDRLTILRSAPLEPGWTGKLWALNQGVARARADMPEAAFLLLTDGDIEHGPGTLRRLVEKAEADTLALTSLMVKLRCESGWERLLVPAFVFFFQKLYPFPWVNDPTRKMAGAAGGCMLVRAQRLGAHDLERIRDRVIDDCALAVLLKARGPIWLGLTDDSHSLRRYDRLPDLWDMVARTAFVQLNHSLTALGGAIGGMLLLYVTPPLAAVLGLWTGDPPAAAAGLVAWIMMAGAYRPTLKLYGQGFARGLALPVAAILYTLMTADSARRHFLGRGGAWKGRSYQAPDALARDNDG